MATLNGKLTPEQQIKFLGRVYGYSRKGHVFLPWVDGSTTDKVSRRNSYHEGRAFKWPAERNTAMLEHLKAHEKDDVYFCPNLFEGKRRIEQYVASETVLYADLDPVDPHKIHDLKFVEVRSPALVLSHLSLFFHTSRFGLMA